MITVLFIIQAIILGALLARWYGRGVTETSKHVVNALSLTYFVLACFPSAGLFSVPAYLGMFGISTGHGQYFLAILMQKCKAEYFDFVVSWVYGKDPRTITDYSDDVPVDKTWLYKRNLFGMLVTGSLVGLPAALVCIMSGNMFGLVLLLTGPVKAFSYGVCDKLGYGTEQAEYLNGALRTLLACITLFGGL